MSTIPTRRRRASLALGTALALVVAPLSLGITPAAALVEPDTATITRYEPFSAAANKVSFWCGEEGGRSINPGGTSWVVDGQYSQVIVKAGSGKYANTVFAEPPTAGQIVWADTNGDGVLNPGGAGGDKGISHIIVCEAIPSPPTTNLVVEKIWTYGEGVPAGFELDETDAGPLTVTVDGKPIDQAWGQITGPWAVDAPVTVGEGDVDDPKDPTGHTCTIQGKPTYEVNGVDQGTTAADFRLLPETNTVVVTNRVDCTKVEDLPTTSLTVVKEWKRGAGVPSGYPTLADKDAGALTVTVDGQATGQEWNDVRRNLPVGVSAVVSESRPTLPAYAGHTCTMTGDPTYVVNGAPAQPTAKFELLATPNTVTVVNSFDCTTTNVPKPSTTSLTVTKAWVYVGAPSGYTATTPGALTVTVAGTATNQAWGATTSGLAVGATANVAEGAVASVPQVDGLTCAAGQPLYAVNGSAATTAAASFTLTAAPNTVVVTNTVTCGAIPVVDDTEDETVVEDVADEDTEESAVAGSEDELAATGGNVTAALLGALLVLSGAALIGSRRRFGMND